MLLMDIWYWTSVLSDAAMAAYYAALTAANGTTYTVLPSDQLH